MKHKYISTPSAPEAIGPYSQAVIAGNFVFCSGQLPINPKTGELVEGIKEGTEQIIKNLKAVLTAEHFDISDIVKTTVYLTDMKDFQEMNEAYSIHMEENRPARACVQVSALPKGAKVEIEAIAYRGN